MSSGLNVDFPARLAEQLERRLNRFSRRAGRLAAELVGSAITDNDPTAIERALVELERRLAEEFTDREFEQDALKCAESVNQRHGRKFFRSLGAAAGVRILGFDDVPEIPVDPTLRQALRKRDQRRPKAILGVKMSSNPAIMTATMASKVSARVQALRRQVIPGIRDEILRELRAGGSPEEIGERLTQRWIGSGPPVEAGRLSRQVALTVRNEVGTLNTQIARARHEAAGVESFIWRTMGDVRVRPLHRSIEGQTFTWANGHPTEVRPGEPDLCRCHAEAVVDSEAVLRAPGFVHLANPEATLTF